MQYQDFVLEASNFIQERSAEKGTIAKFTVRVLISPAGEMSPEQALPVGYDALEMSRQLKQLQQNNLDRAGMVALGRTLGLLLLPESGGSGSPRDLFAKSLLLASQDGGLRLRLRLPPRLAELPWEYLYADRAGSGDGIDGFLALDPRIAIVRHEVVQTSAAPTLLQGDIKVIVALASPLDLEPLDLATEKQIVQEALKNLPGIQVDIVENATLSQVQLAMTHAGVFHFAGHGVADQEMGAQPGSYTLTGSIALDDQMVEAEQLGINLRGEGVRLAVLGGCETARRGGVYVWGAIAPTLAVKAEIPAVVANQYSIHDSSAIAFAQGFYQALAGGLPVEYAVSKGRIAAYNADKNGRDWGVPVLYLRAANGQLFAGAADLTVREQARKAAEADVNLRIREVGPSGKVLGAGVGQMLDGKLALSVAVSGTVFGSVVGAKIHSLTGGNVKIDVSADTVQGDITGIEIGSFRKLPDFDDPKKEK